MTIRTKLICIGGPIHGKHVELDPRLNRYRCVVPEDDSGYLDPATAAHVLNTTGHTYVRRCFSAQENVFTGEKTGRIEALVHADLTMHGALLKVFGYDE